jgi:hypothetical protein
VDSQTVKMELKSLLFILVGLLATSVSAQDASCEFVQSIVGYSCQLTMNNPGGLEVTEITGVHLEGMTDADVTRIVSWQGNSTIVPQRLCTQFPNVVDFDLAFFGVTTITPTSFGSCTNAQFIRMWFNRISEIPVNAFVNNPSLW